MMNLRYERKYLVNGYDMSRVEQHLKLNPAVFRKIYHTRTVNNIYFDSPGLMSYYDNIEGEKQRVKVRIRWYGGTFGRIEKPVLEFKVKEGFLGSKSSYPLNAFSLDKGFNREVIASALEHPDVPANIRQKLLSLLPVLLNSYSRRYFLSGDKNLRLTVDNKLTFYRISYFRNNFINKSVDHDSLVIEMKYEPGMDGKARDVSTFFRFPLTKSSKYLQGLERVIL